MRKNLIFFMTDQQRADTLGMQVNGVPVTPTLTALAQNGTNFATAYNTCPLCVPARTALATGMDPLQNGMTLNDLPGRLAQNHATLHTMLHEAGYEVAHIGVNHISVAPPLKNRLPFAAWQDDDTYAAFAKENGMDISRTLQDSVEVQELCDGAFAPRRYSNARVSVWPYAQEAFKDVWFATHAAEYLRRPHTKPFALFVCLWAPHPPLIVPQAYLDLFPPSAFALPPNTAVPSPGEPQNRRNGAAAQLGQHPPVQGWQEGWSAHCALSRLCDDQLALLLQTLTDTGLRNDTLVVCTTDHGEQMGQHAMYQKMEMYEPAVRVPAVFSMPGAPASCHETPISHLDFVPTILDLLEVTPAQPFCGSSLCASVLRQTPPPQKDVFAVYCGNHAPGDMRRMLVRGSWKYIWDGTAAELYHLADDPLEMHNLATEPAYAETAQALHEALQVWAHARGDVLSYERKEAL